MKKVKNQIVKTHYLESFDTKEIKVKQCTCPSCDGEAEIINGKLKCNNCGYKVNGVIILFSILAFCALIFSGIKIISFF